MKCVRECNDEYVYICMYVLGICIVYVQNESLHVYVSVGNPIVSFHAFPYNMMQGLLKATMYLVFYIY